MRGERWEYWFNYAQIILIILPYSKEKQKQDIKEVEPKHFKHLTHFFSSQFSYLKGKLNKFKLLQTALICGQQNRYLPNLFLNLLLSAVTASFGAISIDVDKFDTCFYKPTIGFYSIVWVQIFSIHAIVKWKGINIEYFRWIFGYYYIP